MDAMLEAQGAGPLDPVGPGHAETTTLTVGQVILPPSGGTHVMMQAMNGPVRYTLDASAPTSGWGFRMRPEDPPQTIRINDNMTLSVIQESAVTPAHVEYMWFRREGLS